MKWFWICFFGFLAVLVATAAIMRPDTVDATLAIASAVLATSAVLGPHLLAKVVAHIVAIGIHEHAVAALAEAAAA